MADTNGYIKLHRSILSWEWYGDIKTRGLFIHLLLSARWEDTRCMGQVIKRGQVCTTVRELSELNGLSTRQTRTALEHLQSTGEIKIQSTPSFSIITVVNYEVYQGAAGATNERQTSGSKIDKPTDKRNDKPILPETSNLEHAENGSVITNSSSDYSSASKPESATPTNQTSSQLTNERQTICSEIDKPSLLYKEIKNKEGEEYARARASGAVSNVLETAVREYNEICKSLEPLTGELSYHQGRLVVEAFKELHGVSFAEYFRRVEASDYLTGRTSRGYKTNFNWLIRPENVAKVLSGKYDRNFESGAVTTSPAKKDYDEPLWDD